MKRIKLKVSRETLRILSANELRAPVGGAAPKSLTGAICSPCATDEQTYCICSDIPTCNRGSC